MEQKLPNIDLGKTQITEWLRVSSKALRITPTSTKCDCGKEGTDKLHACPFDIEINGDHSEKCNCCIDCEGRCAVSV